ncbi:undecaprenyl-phosphate glucose phosphotransferase [Bowmanella sp. Y26]|uniref:undecaprenyl-phosphate glucose phosphotransferase n=1 Tax=Bowmanella yangjiangensis TaxID=2811230 RepID=UPI001BDC95F8|nr:undecaprenyl-phosphate glucose phosphotransferase [Bowmanella yangjiangensis]MBT1065580.1 undecaprenyl-phosphate glucose phosphotransferase [Bowmanella yangjiangensis]
MRSPANIQQGQGFIQSHQNSFATAYRLVDLLLISLSYAGFLFYWQLPLNSTYVVLLLVNVVIYMICAEAMDIYRSWRTASSMLMLKIVSSAWLLTALLTISCLFLFDSAPSIQKNTIVAWIISGFVSLNAWRLVFRWLLAVSRRRGHNTRSAIILGATQVAAALIEQMQRHHQLGIRFEGLFDDRQLARLPDSLTAHVRGNTDEAIALARARKVDHIYIAMPMSAEQRILELLQHCSDTTANVYIIPNFFTYNLLNARWQNVGEVQTLSVFDTPFEGANNTLKRIEDILLSSLILLAIALPMLLIGIAVKLTSPGPAIFKQVRYGLGGKPILVYKFRSMTSQDNGSKVRQATRNDARITALGAFLRRTSLDELPQFINVLQGRMSIVGPRPHAVAHNEEYRRLIEGYMLRHKVRPGITGWAQINGFRGETETLGKMAKRVEYDLDYIHNWSISFDLRIIVMTLCKGFTSSNAY